MSKKRQRIEPGAPTPDMTPMIDCVFQLIIFFMLTAQMASDQAKLILPTPTKSQALISLEDPDDKGKRVFEALVINVPNALGDDPKKRVGKGAGVTGRPRCIVVNGEEVTISNHEKIKIIIKDWMRRVKAQGLSADQYFVEFRVDKDIHWRYVQPLMQVASEAGASKVVFTAIADRKAEINKQ